MKGVVLTPEPQLEELPLPEIGEGQIRIRVHMSLITGLDLDAINGRLPFRGTPGNGFVGTVEDGIGPAARRLVGRRVVSRGSHGCGSCDVCSNGMEYRCLDRVLPGLVGASGGHAEMVVLPARAVVPVPDAVDDSAAVLVPMLAGIYSSFARAQLPDWTNILVIGDGGGGLLASIAFASSGYTVTVRGRHGNRFDLLRRHNINFNLVNDESEMEGTRPGRYGPALMSYPYVVESSGKPSGWLAAVELVSPGGIVFELSSCNDGVPRPVHRVQEKSVRVMGLREGPIEATLRILERGLFDPSEVITRVYDLDDALKAYERAQSGEEWITALRISR